MAIFQDIGTILNSIGNNDFFNDIKLEFQKAKQESLSSKNIKPLVDFYKKYESQFLSKEIGIDNFLKKSIDTEQMPTIETNVQSTKQNTKDNNSFLKEFALPILGLVAGGAAVVILIKTLKK